MTRWWPRKVGFLFLFAGLALLFSSCRKSSFDDAFDPRLLKDRFLAWRFENASDYDFDPAFIEIRDGKAVLKTVDQTHLGDDFAAGVHRETVFQDGLLQPDPALPGLLSLDGAWAPRNSNLVAFWKFDGNTTATRGSKTITATGSPSFSTERKIGTHSVAFNGSTGFYAVAPEKNYGAMTASLWVKINGWTGAHAPLLFRMNGETLSPRLDVASNGQVQLEYRLCGGVLSAASPAGAVDAGSWHHVAATLTPSGGAKIYVNGALVAVNPTAGTCLSTGSNDMLIGRDTDRNVFLDGRMDELGIWDVALTSDEVERIYLKQVAKFAGTYLSPVIDLGSAAPWTALKPTTPLPFHKPLPGDRTLELTNAYSALTSRFQDDLAAYWPLNETAHDTVSATHDFRDYSGANNHLTQNGGVTLNVKAPFTRGARFDGVNDSATATVDLSSTDKVTVSFWMKWDESYQSDTIILESSTNFNASTTGFLVNANPSGQGGANRISFGIKGAGYNLSNINRPNDGRWHHYVIVMDKAAPAAGEVIPYLDGKAISYTKSHTVNNTNAFGNNMISVMSRNGSSLPGKGDIAELAIWKRPLSPAEITELYRRGANRIFYQVRSCVDVACECKSFNVSPAGSTGDCDGDGIPNDSDPSDAHAASWIGPDGTPNSSFSEAHNALALDGSGAPVGASTSLGLTLDWSMFPTAARPADNRFFRYRVHMQSDDENDACSGEPCLPGITSVEVGPGDRYYGGSPALSNKSGLSYSKLDALIFSQGGSCTVRYQLSNDGTNFRYWNGSGWAFATEGVVHSATAEETQANVKAFEQTVGIGKFHFKAFLKSDTTQNCEITSVELQHK